MKITLENFKNFALNNPLNKTVDYCEQLVEKQGIESVELGPLLCEMHGTFIVQMKKSPENSILMVKSSLQRILKRLSEMTI